MDEAQLKNEGVYQTFESITQHTEIPGWSDGFLITLLRLYQVQCAQLTFDIVIFGQSCLLLALLLTCFLIFFRLSFS
jgi:hypothetical protein